MLYKKIISIDELNDNNSKSIVIANSKEDIDMCINKKFRKISIDSKLLNESLRINFKYIRVYFDKKKDIELLKSIKNKNNFIELILPLRSYIEDKQIISNAGFCDRLVFEFSKEEELKLINSLFSDLILNEQYPFVKNVPLCRVAVQHTFELFNETNSEKSSICGDCIYKKKCNYEKNSDFRIKPILEDEEFVKFVNKNEDTTYRI